MRLTRLLTEEEIKLANDYSTNDERKHKQGDFTIYNNVSPFDVENKLGQLEDIEEELGIDLIKFFMGFKKNVHIYYKKGKKIKEGIMTLGILSKYGKTWALTKEELL